MAGRNKAQWQALHGSYIYPPLYFPYITLALESIRDELDTCMNYIHLLQSMIPCDAVKGGYESDIHLETSSSYQTTPSYSITGALMSTLSFSSQTGRERKTVTFDTSLLPIPSRGIKRSIEEDLYLDDPVAKRGRLPEYMTADRLTSDSITYNADAFTATSLWAAGTAWDSHSIYDAPEEEAAKVGTPVEATEHGLSSVSTSTTKTGLYTEISRAISRLIEGSITRSELIESLRRVTSQLKQWG
ncbi:uncharacterized protein ARMOST_11201 [Armillaria ostoyae]|uniref:Uncharacterized protein n=1 Tax=Armillaria ostoyae TaxID=47428 RepID=A0A284RGH2_ARMOS|nr:uncharacterized protein ARMOST_11201 [Armillaria ostoyae]